MNKKERLNKIMQLLNENGTINNNDIMQQLQVSDMTIRRDLDELEKAGKLIRFHGGAQSMSYKLDFELSHLEKSTVNMDEKKAIAKQASLLVEEGDTIFLGPGTTIEILASLLAERKVRIVTNSLPVFNRIQDSETCQVILAGGTCRTKTGCFVGPIANQVIGSMHYQKAFFSCNGISNGEITTSSMEEGDTQRIALEHSRSKYLLADTSKFNHQDTFIYYRLNNLDGLITNAPIPPHIQSRYAQITNIIAAQ